MKTKSILFLFLFHFGISFGQSVLRNTDIFNPNGGLLYSKLYKGNSNSEIQGSVHLFNSWEGNYIIQSVKGMRYNLNSFNYNLQSKKMESRLAKDSVFELKANQIDYILANNKRYKVINEELYQEMNNGKFKIYKQFSVKVQEAFMNPMTKSESGSPQYVQTAKYFYFKNDVLVPFKLKKKDVLTFLKDKETEVKTFASEKDFSFKDEADVVKIVNYYNSL